jgi:exosortase/archaeosortase family protein
MKKAKKKVDFFDRKKLEAVAWFLIKFNLLAIPLYLILYFNLSFSPLQTFFATLSHSTLNVFGYNVTQDGFWLTTSTDNGIQRIQISWDSSGWKSMYALAALVIATPVSNISRKLRFIPIGILIIFLLNYLRITSTILISLIFGFNYFEIVHVFLWREGLIFAVVAIWYLWFRKEKYNYR